EAARHGILLLNNIEALPLPFQRTLAKAFQTITDEIHVICISDLPLDEQLGDGNLDTKLYFELATETIPFAPLRDRREDIGPILRFLNSPAAGRYLPRILSTGEIEALIAELTAAPPADNLRTLERRIRESAESPARV